MISYEQREAFAQPPGTAQRRVGRLRGRCAAWNSITSESDVDEGEVSREKEP